MTAAERTRFPGLARPRPLLWVRVLRGVLWLLVAAGPVAAGLLTVQVSGLRHQVDQVSQQAAVELPSSTAGVEGFAELLVAALLSADDDAAPPLAGSLGARSVREKEQASWWVVRTVSLGAEEVAPGYFAVTVAAEVVAKDPDSAEQPSWMLEGIRFFAVGVVEAESGWAAVGPPAMVAAPTVGSPPDLLVRRFDGLRDVAGLEEAVSRFLVAYLAGDGELARYVAPGSALTSVLPPPFATVEILDVGAVQLADGAREVVAVVQGTDEAGRAQVLQYALVVAERDGRWEVVELLPAPSLAERND